MAADNNFQGRDASEQLLEQVNQALQIKIGRASCRERVWTVV